MAVFSIHCSLRFPAASANASGRGWQTWYSGSGYNTADGEVPAGQSYHLTSADGASMSLSFYGTICVVSDISSIFNLRFRLGTAITLYGTSNCTYDVTIDGSLHSSLTPHQTILFSEGHLSPTTHILNLTAHPLSTEEQSLAFTQAVITSTVNGSLVFFSSFYP